jgi:hypothetical protein
VAGGDRLHHCRQGGGGCFQASAQKGAGLMRAIFFCSNTSMIKASMINVSSLGLTGLLALLVLTPSSKAERV